MKKLYFVLLSFVLLTSYAAYSQPNDDCSGAITINCGQTISATTTGATADAVANCGGTALNTAPGVWYTFVGDGSTVTLSLCGSSYDTKIGVFTGSCGSFTCVTGNDDFCGLQSQVSFPSVNGTTYFVLVTGFNANAGSFTLARTCAAATPNDDCSGALPINCGQTITSTTVGANPDAVGTCITALNTAPGVWYSFTGDGSTTTLSLCGSGYDTKIGVFSGTCGALVCVTGNDDFCGLQSQVTLVATAGTQYFVLVTGFNANAGAFTLTRTCIPPNDLCSNAIPIACGQTLNGSSLGATADAAPSCTGTTNPGVWYTFTGVGGTETLSTCAGASFDTKLSVYSGTCAAPVCVAGNDDFCGVQSQVTFTSVFGATYYVLVHGFGGATGTFSLTRTCPPPCAGVPSPGAISGPSAPVCSGATVNLSVSGFSNVGGLSFQWKSSATAGGPYTPITGANTINYSFTATATAYYIVTVTCNNTGGGSANTVEFPVRVSALAHSNVLATPSTMCSPGATVITATVSGSATAGNYTHTLTGPGTIGAPVVSGTNNSNVSFSVTAIPAGVQTYTLKSTDAGGCSVTSTVTITVNQTPVVTITGSTSSCVGSLVRIDAQATPAAIQTFNSLANTHIPAGGNTQGIASPYPNTINVSGIIPTNATVRSVTLNNFSHTLPDDVDIVLVSPNNQMVILMSDAGGSTPATGQTFTFSDAAATTLADNSFNPTGTYKPTNYGGGDNWPAPGPGTAPTSTTLSTFTGAANGNWNLYVFDDQGNETGFIATWSISFDVPAPVTFSPVANLFTDAGGTVAYTGTPVYTVWARTQSTSTTYTATATVAGCTGSNTITITPQFAPAITAQPSPASQAVCTGLNVVYSVTATGTGLTYQWRKNGVNLVNGSNIAGATSSTLTISNFAGTDAATYDVVVSGTCTPSVTSTPVVLTLATPPVVTVQPANQIVCVGTNAVFTFTATGSPTPSVFQWQTSTDNATWTDIAGATGATLTVANPTAANNGRFYRVRITYICGGTFVFSNSATLTVNALIPAVATDLWTRTICLSDSLVPLVGTPVGGSWSGIGVSGFNFVPSSTGVGTYILTYTYTGNNGTGCTSTDTTLAIVRDCGDRMRRLADDAVLLFPNPNNGRFNIRINSTLYNYLGMRVYNMNGQLVNGRAEGKVLVTPTLNGLTYGRVVPIDLSYLPAGTYLVRFYYDDGIRSSEKSFKVVISHD